MSKKENYENAINLLMNLGWSKAFCREYYMERVYNGHSHSEAFEKTMNSVWINDEDKPKARV